MMDQKLLSSGSEDPMCHPIYRASLLIGFVAAVGCSDSDSQSADQLADAASDSNASGDRSEDNLVDANDSGAGSDAEAEGAYTEASAADRRAADAEAGAADAGQDAADAALPQDGSADQWIDDAGHCRSNRVPQWWVCPASYQAAVAGGSPCGASILVGRCGDMLVWTTGPCTPGTGCAYDSAGTTLVARAFWDDVQQYCGDRSHEVLSPNWPADCQLGPLDAGLADAPTDSR